MLKSILESQETKVQYDFSGFNLDGLNDELREQFKKYDSARIASEIRAKEIVSDWKQITKIVPLGPVPIGTIFKISLT